MGVRYCDHGEPDPHDCVDCRQEARELRVEAQAEADGYYDDDPPEAA